MAVLEQLPAQYIIDGLRGTVDFYCYKGKFVARRWPRSPGKNRTTPVLAGSDRFTYIQQMGKELPKDIIEDYQRMASGTPYVWRDWMTRLFLAGHKIATTVLTDE